MAVFRKKYSSMTDEELMLLVQQKEPEAFSALYDRYAGRMLNFFYPRLGSDEPKSQDFLHDLFVKILENPGSFTHGNRVSSWIYSIAMNMCKNEYRSQKVRQDYRIFVQNRSEEAMVHDHGSIDRKLFSKELDLKLDLLPATHREVFLLRYREDLSIAEIARVMEIPEGTVKSRLFHVLRTLALRLKTFDPVNT
jgi:RNA polymerase sigma-70 factor (ECF subfamily)